MSFEFIQEPSSVHTVKFPLKIFVTSSRDRFSLCEDIEYDKFIAQLPHFSTERIENTEMIDNDQDYHHTQQCRKMFGISLAAGECES